MFGILTIVGFLWLVILEKVIDQQGERLMQHTSFITDKEKMRDFKILTKEEFLKSYSYLTEAEYDLTVKEKS